ncbi:MAG: hypothetical protein QOF83_459 [Solirubrobacteraceae bacterium]|jgi:hypothetical protein|nr:hypothetical protein [Solirubrobacteraceae bacterium]
MVISHHIITAHADARVATLRRDAAPRQQSVRGGRRLSRSRRRRAYRAHILGLHGVAR